MATKHDSLADLTMAYMDALTGATPEGTSEVDRLAALGYIVSVILVNWRAKGNGQAAESWLKQMDKAYRGRR